MRKNFFCCFVKNTSFRLGPRTVDQVDLVDTVDETRKTKA